MKTLFIALICTMASFGALANDQKSTEKAAVVKTEVISTNASERTESMEASESNARRYQMSFVFLDGCGHQMTVWVSGPHSATSADLFGVAYAHAESQLHSNGCF